MGDYIILHVLLIMGKLYKLSIIKCSLFRWFFFFNAFSMSNCFPFSLDAPSIYTLHLLNIHVSWLLSCIWFTNIVVFLFCNYDRVLSFWFPPVWTIYVPVHDAQLILAPLLFMTSVYIFILCIVCSNEFLFNVLNIYSDTLLLSICHVFVLKSSSHTVI